MRSKRLLLMAVVLARRECKAERVRQVGPAAEGGFIVTTEQLIRPAGRSVEFAGRPIDLAVSPDGETVYAKASRSVLAIDRASWTIRQELRYAAKVGGGSMHGIIVTPDGRRVLATVQSHLVWAD